MSVIGASLDILEGESSRFLWLPAITCGYLSTLSASGIDFFFMVVSIIGARFIADAVKISDGTEGSPAHFEFEGRKARIVEAILILYLLAGVYSPLRLSTVFSYDQPIIVGLSGFWVGLILILIMDWYLDIESAVNQRETD